MGTVIVKVAACLHCPLIRSFESIVGPLEVLNLAVLADFLHRGVPQRQTQMDEWMAQTQSSFNDDGVCPVHSYLQVGFPVYRTQAL